MSSPQQASITYGSTITWVGGQVFDGFAVIYIATPVNTSSESYPYVDLYQSSPGQRLPDRTVVPIKAGVYDANTKLYFTSNIQPPNTRYVAYFYDQSKRLIAPIYQSTSLFFQVEETPYTLIPPALPVPTVTTSPVTPD